MDGKRRQYVSPAIGGPSTPRSAAAAAAEAAAKRLISLRRTAVEQRQQQSTLHGHQEHLSQSVYPQSVSTTSPQSSSSTRSVPSHAPPMPPPIHHSTLPRTSSPVSPHSSSTSDPSSYTPTYQQQQQPFSPSSSIFLQGGFSKASTTSPPPPSYRTFPQTSSDTTLAARARAAAAAAALSTSSSIPFPPTGSHHSRANRDAVGNDVFALPRPESFHSASPRSPPAAVSCAASLPSSSSATATASAAAAAAAAASYLRTRGGQLTASADSGPHPLPFPLPASPYPLSASPSQAPLGLQRPPSNAVAAVHSPSYAGAAASAVAETTPQHLPAWWPPSKREREGKGGSASGAKKEEGDGNHPQPDHQATLTEADFTARTKERRRSSSCSSGSGSGNTNGSCDSSEEEAALSGGENSSSNSSSSSASLLKPTSAAQPKSSTKVGGVSGSDANNVATPACGAWAPADRLSLIVSAASLTKQLKRLFKGISRTSPMTEENEGDGGGKGLEKNELDVAVAAAAEHGSTATTTTHPRDAWAAEERRWLCQLHAALGNRDNAMLKRRITKAAALPPPPASHVLNLLEQIPDVPRRAVYSREDCPCSVKDGFNEEFHECVQQCMTRIALQRDGRMRDAPPAPADKTATAAAEQQRHQRRFEELTSGVPADVRDVVAFARFVAQQQLLLPHAAVHFSSAVSSSPGAGAEDVNASVSQPLESLRAFIEAKVLLMRSADTGIGLSAAATSTIAKGVIEAAQSSSGGVEKAVSPMVEVGASGRPVATSLATAHQHFITLARSASSARQEKAEAAQQAEQRLVAAATAWHDNFLAMLRESGGVVSGFLKQRQMQRQSVGGWHRLMSQQGTASEELLQRLQQLLLPHQGALGNEQIWWEAEAKSGKRRKRRRTKSQFGSGSNVHSRLELPQPPI